MAIIMTTAQAAHDAQAAIQELTQDMNAGFNNIRGKFKELGDRITATNAVGGDAIFKVTRLTGKLAALQREVSDAAFPSMGESIRLLAATTGDLEARLKVTAAQSELTSTRLAEFIKPTDKPAPAPGRGRSANTLVPATTPVRAKPQASLPTAPAHTPPDLPPPADNTRKPYAGTALKRKLPGGSPGQPPNAKRLALRPARATPKKPAAKPRVDTAF
ncbi:hypothetical protein G6O67_007122 [Ophiocordyceps sinensis]|uniref:Uncharacterized protein n=2 Tax=Ophiocordyceps sinensis TaxID=72228 RepID=A0A8H4LUI2_9HYPO|nr:hypothetical protein OCS_03340 [Ophiocordyceps sinensis CO18]KAF4505142.1 hypothetical protein G6O67_007122 [Ophiocordyceps sinensis]